MYKTSIWKQLINLSLCVLTLSATGKAFTEDNQDTASSISWTLEEAEALTHEIRSGDYQTVTSVIVQQNNETLYEAYFNGADRETLHDTRSATKTIAGLLVGIAIDQGLIGSVQTPVESFFTDYFPTKNMDARKREITLEDFLTMSSLLECNDFNPYSRGNEERMYITEDWIRFTLNLPIKGFAPWETRPNQTPFGRSFSYCTAGVHVLGQVIARASHQTLPDYAREFLFAPLGISDVEWQFTSLDRATTAGGVRLSSRSLAKLGSLFLYQGQYNEHEVVSADWIRSSLQSHAEIGDGHEYGYLVWKRETKLADRSVTSHFMSGNGGNHVVAIPELNIVMVITKTDYNQPGAHDAARNLADKGVLSRLYGIKIHP